MGSLRTSHVDLEDIESGGVDVEAGENTGFGAGEVGARCCDQGKGGGAEEVAGEREADAARGGRDEHPGSRHCRVMIGIV